MAYGTGGVFKIFMDGFGMKGIGVRDWMRYRSFVRQAMNEKRNNTANALKTKFISK